MAINRPVTIESVIVRTEGPDLVLGVDQFKTPYLCALVSRDEDGDRFVAVKVSDSRLVAVRSGRFDVRFALTSPESEEYFEGFFERIDGTPTINLRETLAFPEEWLPKEGLYVTDFVPALEQTDVVAAANENHTTTIICRLNPPEAKRRKPRINADRLADYVANFQQLVKHVIAKGRRLVDPDLYTLQVATTLGGSFQIQFEAASDQIRLFEGSEVGDAMRKIDVLLDVMDKPADDILKVAQDNRGLVIGAYRSLLEFAAEQDTPVEYRWAEPGATQETYRQIRPHRAKQVCAILDLNEELGTETVRFVGTFFKVHVPRGQWGLLEQKTGKKKYGGCEEGNNSLLSGIITDTTPYEITCDARLERTSDGRSTTKLILRDYAEYKPPDESR